MKVWNANEDQIREAIRQTGLKVYGEWRDYGPGNGIARDGRALRFRLGIDTTQDRDRDGFLPYQRCSTWAEQGHKPRKVAAVCWHGHRDFMRALFALAPDARIKTALADYRNSDHFEGTYLDTFGTGNDWNVSYGQACNCHNSPRERLEYLRGEIRAERISYREIAELEGLAAHIEPGDVELLEWAGVPEFEEVDA